jgi:hypothetical protein
MRPEKSKTSQSCLIIDVILTSQLVFGSFFAFKMSSIAKPTENSIFRNDNSYQTINGTEVEGKEEPMTESSKAKKILGFSALAFFFFICGILFVSGTNSYMAVKPPSGGSFTSGKCAPCTFMQCKANLCDASLTPYECTKGGAVGGCTQQEVTSNLYHI